MSRVRHAGRCVSIGKLQIGYINASANPCWLLEVIGLVRGLVSIQWLSIWRAALEGR